MDNGLRELALTARGEITQPRVHCFAELYMGLLGMIYSEDSKHIGSVNKWQRSSTL